MTRHGIVLAALGFAFGCGSGSDAEGPEPATSSGQEVPAQSTAQIPPFASGQQRCLYAPDGELASCEEVSVDGAGRSTPRENCAQMGGQFAEGTCPTERRLALCDTTDGVGMQGGEYALRVHYYESALVPTAARAGELCGMLSGTFTPL